MGNEDFIVKFIVSIVTLCLGAVLGYVIDIRKHNRTKNIDYNMTIFGIYKDISSEIIETLIPLVSLSLRRREITVLELEKWRKEVSYLYFKHYIYLPQTVLNELNCLHSCIQGGGKNLYCVKNKNEIKQCNAQDVITLFEDTALVGGERDRIENLIANYPLQQFGKSLKINLQARRVIRITAAIFENRTINQWEAILKKETLLQARSNDYQNSL